MHTLIAFDKFKGSLAAPEACRVAAAAVREATPKTVIEEAPLTDGGEGFATLLTETAGGELRHCRAAGPLGSPVDAAWGIVSIEKLSPKARELLDLPSKGRLAIVEMAQASGLQLIPEETRDPWKTGTRGTGELLEAAAAARPAAILLGIGGSATHDLGLGALHVLGLKANFAHSPDSERPLAPENWKHITAFHGTLKPDMPPIIIASDVNNPLLGERGAARVFAPQKGLHSPDLDRLEAETARIGRLLCARFGQSDAMLMEPGSGAAGGIGAGLRAAYGSRIVSGFGLVRAWMDLDRKIAKADVILTGEGSFDASSLEGKGPGAIVRAAAASEKPCLVFAGRIDISDTAKEEYPKCRFIEISPREWPVQRALSEAKMQLKKSVKIALKTLR